LSALNLQGGDQGGEGEGGGAEWYIENIREELDAPNEFFFGNKTRTLYYVLNQTAAAAAQDPGDLEFTATHLAVLFNVSGSAANPVQSFTLAGVEVTGTRDVFMEPQSLPSGGDWAVQRSGAVVMRGTVNASVSCLRQRQAQEEAAGAVSYRNVLACGRYVTVFSSSLTAQVSSSTATIDQLRLHTTSL
jgi:hypothetical protein